MNYADFLAELQEFMTRMDEFDGPEATESEISERFSAEELTELRHRLEAVLASLPPVEPSNPVH